MEMKFVLRCNRFISFRPWPLTASLLDRFLSKKNNIARGEMEVDNGLPQIAYAFCICIDYSALLLQVPELILYHLDELDLHDSLYQQ
jgi:hypothetical protein